MEIIKEKFEKIKSLCKESMDEYGEKIPILEKVFLRMRLFLGRKKRV